MGKSKNNYPYLGSIASVLSENLNEEFQIEYNVLIRYIGSNNNVVIPAWVTVIGKFAFSEHSISSVQIPDSVTEIQGGAFSFCLDLTTVTIPDSVTVIDNSAFWGCSSLKEVSLPKGIKLGTSAFPPDTRITYRDKKNPSLSEKDRNVNSASGSRVINASFILHEGILQTFLGGEKTFIIPDQVKIIGESAFARCTELISIEIPDSVEAIRDCAFACCNNLKEITLPQNIKIGENVFYQCQNLNIIKIRFAGGAVGTFDKTALTTMFQKL